jgi:hypothetical protein
MAGLYLILANASSQLAITAVGVEKLLLSVRQEI